MQMLERSVSQYNRYPFKWNSNQLCGKNSQLPQRREFLERFWYVPAQVIEVKTPAKLDISTRKKEKKQKPSAQAPKVQDTIVKCDSTLSHMSCRISFTNMNSYNRISFVKLPIWGDMVPLKLSLGRFLYRYPPTASKQAIISGFYDVTTNDAGALTIAKEQFNVYARL